MSTKIEIGRGNCDGCCEWLETPPLVLEHESMQRFISRPGFLDTAGTRDATLYKKVAVNETFTVYGDYTVEDSGSVLELQLKVDSSATRSLSMEAADVEFKSSSVSAESPALPTLSFVSSDHSYTYTNDYTGGNFCSPELPDPVGVQARREYTISFLAAGSNYSRTIRAVHSTTGIEDSFNKADGSVCYVVTAPLTNDATMAFVNNVLATPTGAATADISHEDFGDQYPETNTEMKIEGSLNLAEPFDGADLLDDYQGFDPEGEDWLPATRSDCAALDPHSQEVNSAFSGSRIVGQGTYSGAVYVQGFKLIRLRIKRTVLGTFSPAFDGMSYIAARLTLLSSPASGPATESVHVIEWIGPFDAGNPESQFSDWFYFPRLEDPGTICIKRIESRVMHSQPWKIEYEL